MGTRRKTSHSRRYCALPVFVLLAAVTFSVPAQPARFAISGDARLATDAPVQDGGRFVLKAQLAAPAGASATVDMQTDSRFALSAVLSTSSLVCYNDTIFRDGFDGTGL